MEEQISIPNKNEDKEEYLENLAELDEVDNYRIEFINEELERSFET